ncbi:MAG TPA: addiction module protein [Longimicrobium sp.]|nr:addiction module protein [Longimicrobium sp.]
MTRLEEIKAAVLSLTREDQAEIADAILANIADPGPLSDAWKAELDWRTAEVEAGQVELIDNEEVFSYVRARLRGDARTPENTDG